MKAIIRVLIFLLIVVSFSCEEQGWIVKCSECISTEPEAVSVTMRLTYTDLPAEIKIYEGELEDSILYASAIISGDSYSYSVIINKKYTITATYQIDNNTYTAVDSAVPRVRYSTNDCEDPCYFAYDKEVDLRLKYTANN